MNSLRGRAALVAATVCMLVMAISDFSAWWWMRDRWLTTFDQAMQERARTLALQSDTDDDDHVTLGANDHAGRPNEEFAIWNENGSLLHASENRAIINKTEKLPATTTLKIIEHDKYRILSTHIPLEKHEEREHEERRKKTERNGDEEDDESESELSAEKKRDKKHQPKIVLVTLAWDASELNDSLTALGIVLKISLILSGFVGAAALWIAMRTALKPVVQLTRRIEALAPDKVLTPLTTTDLPKEIRPVAERFDALLVRVHAAMERERSFSGAVAHELRTPIAGLRAQLEQKLFSADEQKTCHDITLHVQAIIEKLLMLTRLQSGQMKIANDPVDFSGLIEVAWESHKDAVQQRQLQATIEIIDTDSVKSDRDLLRRIVDNIIANAIAHSDQGGTIILRIEREEKSLCFTCRNSGCHLPAGDASYTTARFWSGDAARRIDSSHHCGLGLALCAEIAQALHISFSVSVTADKWFVAQVRVPC